MSDKNYFITNTRGKNRNFVSGGYVYNFEYTYENAAPVTNCWRCSISNCKGKVLESDGQVTRVVIKHNHKPDQDRIDTITLISAKFWVRLGEGSIQEIPVSNTTAEVERKSATSQEALPPRPDEPRTDEEGHRISDNSSVATTCLKAAEINARSGHIQLEHSTSECTQTKASHNAAEMVKMKATTQKSLPPSLERLRTDEQSDDCSDNNSVATTLLTEAEIDARPSLIQLKRRWISEYIAGMEATFQEALPPSSKRFRTDKQGLSHFDNGSVATIMPTAAEINASPSHIQLEHSTSECNQETTASNIAAEVAGMSASLQESLPAGLPVEGPKTNQRELRISDILGL